jgi:ribosomal protein S27AE
MAIFHGDDILEPCSRHPEIQTLHACPRCLTHSEGVALAEHLHRPADRARRRFLRLYCWRCMPREVRPSHVQLQLPDVRTMFAELPARSMMQRCSFPEASWSLTTPCWCVGHAWGGEGKRRRSTRRARACRGGHDTGWRHTRRRSRTVSTGAANACLADHVAELAQLRKTDRAVERYCVSQPPRLARAGSLSR